MIRYYNSVEPKNTSYQVIGEGKRALMVVCYASDASPVHLAKLNQIIEAIRYHPQEDTYLCKIDDEGELPLMTELSLQYNLKHIIIFTDQIHKIRSNVDFQYYKRFHFENCEILVVESINKIMDDAQRKKKLWVTLQEIFLKKQFNG